MGSFSIYLKIGIIILFSVLVIFFSYSFILNLEDFSAKAAVIVGIIAFLGTIFTTLITELSSFYNRKKLILEKKWDLIFPLVKQHYNPCLNSAKSLQNALSKLLDVCLESPTLKCRRN